MEHAIVLAGHGIRLVPIAEEHAAALAAGLDAELWAGFARPLPASPEEYLAYLRGQIAADGTRAFTVLDAADGAVLGSTSLYDLSVSQRRVEIGSTWYVRRVWRTAVNPAAKLLLFGHAFEDLGMERVALRCDARNEHSRRAIERLGAVYEGRLRSHRVAPDGSRQDTLYFSVLRDEWPAVRAVLEERLRTADRRRP